MKLFWLLLPESYSKIGDKADRLDCLPELSKYEEAWTLRNAPFHHTHSYPIFPFILASMRSFSIPWVYKPGSMATAAARPGGLEAPKIASASTANASSPSEPETMGQIRRSSTPDTDMMSYFLVRKIKKGSVDSDSTTVSPRLGEAGTGTYQAPKSRKPGDSKGSGDLGKATLEGSEPVELSQSMASRYRSESKDPALKRSKSQKRHPLDPPRPAKEGMEWVWFPDGYWAEREVRDFAILPIKEPSLKKLFVRSPDRRTTDSPSRSIFAITPPKSIIPRIEIGSLKSFGNSSKVSLSETKTDPPVQQSPRKPSSSSTLPPLVEKESMYCRVRKKFSRRTNEVR